MMTWTELLFCHDFHFLAMTCYEKVRSAMEATGEIKLWKDFIFVNDFGEIVWTDRLHNHNIEYAFSRERAEPQQLA
jgi:hypothetical protein